MERVCGGYMIGDRVKVYHQKFKEGEYVYGEITDIDEAGQMSIDPKLPPARRGWVVRPSPSSFNACRVLKVGQKPPFSLQAWVYAKE